MDRLPRDCWLIIGGYVGFRTMWECLGDDTFRTEWKHDTKFWRQLAPAVIPAKTRLVHSAEIELARTIFAATPMAVDACVVRSRLALGISPINPESPIPELIATAVEFAHMNPAIAKWVCSNLTTENVTAVTVAAATHCNHDVIKHIGACTYHIGLRGFYVRTAEACAKPAIALQLLDAIPHCADSMLANGAFGEPWDPLWDHVLRQAFSTALQYGTVMCVAWNTCKYDPGYTKTAIEMAGGIDEFALAVAGVVGHDINEDLCVICGTIRHDIRGCVSVGHWTKSHPDKKSREMFASSHPLWIINLIIARYNLTPFMVRLIHELARKPATRKALDKLAKNSTFDADPSPHDECVEHDIHESDYKNRYNVGRIITNINVANDHLLWLDCVTCLFGRATAAEWLRTVIGLPEHVSPTMFECEIFCWPCANGVPYIHWLFATQQMEIIDKLCQRYLERVSRMADETYMCRICNRPNANPHYMITSNNIIDEYNYMRKITDLTLESSVEAAVVESLVGKFRLPRGGWSILYELGARNLWSAEDIKTRVIVSAIADVCCSRSYCDRLRSLYSEIAEKGLSAMMLTWLLTKWDTLRRQAYTPRSKLSPAAVVFIARYLHMTSEMAIHALKLLESTNVPNIGWHPKGETDCADMGDEIECCVLYLQNLIGHK